MQGISAFGKIIAMLLGGPNATLATDPLASSMSSVMSGAPAPQGTMRNAFSRLMGQESAPLPRIAQEPQPKIAVEPVQARKPELVPRTTRPIPGTSPDPVRPSPNATTPSIGSRFEPNVRSEIDAALGGKPVTEATRDKAAIGPGEIIGTETLDIPPGMDPNEFVRQLREKDKSKGLNAKPISHNMSEEEEEELREGLQRKGQNMTGIPEGQPDLQTRQDAGVSRLDSVIRNFIPRNDTTVESYIHPNVFQMMLEAEQMRRAEGKPQDL